MNSSQIASLARWLVNAISGGIITYTATKSPAAQSMAAFLANLITGPDVIAAVMLGITWLWGHITHASDSPTTKTPGGGATVALFLVAGLLFGAGCKSTPQQVTYQATGTAIVSVDAAMNLWGAYVAANHPGTNAEVQVKAAYEKYQAAMLVATDAGAAYAAGGTNSTASLILNQAVSDANNDLIELQNLLTTFGVKLK